VGKTDIEDALLKLENAILDEMRMAGAESLKGIHVLQGIVEDRVGNVEDILQGINEKMKDISRMGINSAQITVQLVIFHHSQCLYGQMPRTRQVRVRRQMTSTRRP
jgi:hypothetical protein